MTTSPSEMVICWVFVRRSVELYVGNGMKVSWQNVINTICEEI